MSLAAMLAAVMVPSCEEPTAFQQLKEDPNLRHEAIRRLKHRGVKQPKVHQIIAEIRRMS